MSTASLIKKVSLLSLSVILSTHYITGAILWPRNYNSNHIS